MFTNTAQTYYFHLIDSSNNDVTLVSPVTITFSNPETTPVVKTGVILSPGRGYVSILESDFTLPGTYTVSINNNGLLSHPSDTVTITNRQAPATIPVVYDQPTTIIASVSDNAGSVLNITASMITLMVKISPSNSFISAGTIQVLDPVNGKVSVVFTPSGKGEAYLLVDGLQTTRFQF